ncbi:helix-turn-helix transcriptional regulator [Arsenophonus nasoniae]|uniref:LuxR C-terminal-related transcriptional regulator n=1 Tax=Arsenophonus nasoniae TaxID=638 RepID=A0AA95GVW0_9GAMM|nr:LuxR C-terminal-related transcriptional regulator [Arsenophonus nasoniae]WGM04096.1 LuxR C-terminal-related transcriptional regulator [Arsenophonus nasoniae]
MATANASTSNFNFSAYSSLFPELTTTEKDVVMLFSIGFSVKKIASIRNVSPFTVKNQLSAAKENLEVNSLDDIRSIALLRILIEKN